MLAAEHVRFLPYALPPFLSWTHPLETVQYHLPDWPEEINYLGFKRTSALS